MRPILFVPLLLLVLPSGAASVMPAAPECRAEEYIVLPLGPGYVDVRILTDGDPSQRFIALWTMVYGEAGGDPAVLERGDDLDVLGNPSDSVCGELLMPPLVDDLLVAW